MTVEYLFIYYMGFNGVPNPQLIHDIEMFEYQVEQNRIPVIQRHIITREEASLGLNKLMLLYPCVCHTDEADNEDSTRYLSKPEPEGGVPS